MKLPFLMFGEPIEVANELNAMPLKADLDSMFALRAGLMNALNRIDYLQEARKRSGEKKVLADHQVDLAIVANALREARQIMEDGFDSENGAVVDVQKIRDVYGFLFTDTMDGFINQYGTS